MEQCYRNLAAAVLLQAAKDYCDRGTTKEQQKVIIKDLKGQWMDFFTNGTSKSVANELLTNEKIIRIRLKKCEELN